MSFTADMDVPASGSFSAMTHKCNPTLGVAARDTTAQVLRFVVNLLVEQHQEHEPAPAAWHTEAAIRLMSWWKALRRGGSSHWSGCRPRSGGAEPR
jgi:hypothetical protein